jgi:glycosyltransferase involved in cell wall biosynthesis
MLSVIIPSRVERYLQKTVDDLNNKAKEPIEIIVVLDGYIPEEPIKGAVVLPMDKVGMRACINKGMGMSQGTYVMKLDEHCMFDDGFDVKLKEDCKDNWVIVPRRYRLDADDWKIMEDGRPPVDYMYQAIIGGVMRGWKDLDRAEKNKDILVDDTMSFQGSCYFMHRKYWFDLIHPMDDANYGPFANEAQEICNRVWLSGGEVKVNKKTWYAHWYRTQNLYNFSKEQLKEFNKSIDAGHKYCTNYWLNEWRGLHDYKWLVDKFNPPTKRAI